MLINHQNPFNHSLQQYLCMIDYCTYVKPIRVLFLLNNNILSTL